MSDAEFGGIGFAAGVVTGARSFKVDKLGRLTGVTYPEVWKPGENLAVCKKTYNDTSMSAIYPMQSQYNYSSPRIPGRNEYVPPGAQQIDERRDMGVRGEMTIRRTYMLPDGTRYEQTFESPGAGYYAIPQMITRQPEKKLPKNHKLDTCQHGFYGYYDGSDDYNKDGMVSAVVEGYGETVIGTRGFRSMRARIVAMRITDKVKPSLAEVIARNYADVPQFDSFRAMVRAFPCDGGELAVKPAVPELTDDFWTKKA